MILFGNLDVDGQTDLDVLNVLKPQHLVDVLDANNNAEINSLKVEDLTNDRVVIAGRVENLKMIVI